MFYNLKVALRILRFNRMYSIINIIGLVVSLVSCILIMLWIQDEMSFNKFHKRSKDIYAVNYRFEKEGKDNYWEAICAPVAVASKEEIPQIENSCRIINKNDIEFIKSENQTLTDLKLGIVDSSFFSIFDFQITAGNSQQLFTDNHSAIISERVANILFKDKSPIGKTFQASDGSAFQVTAVMADILQNSSNRYDILFPFSLFESQRPESKNDWDGSFNCRTYFLLRKGATVQEVYIPLNKIFREHNPGSESTNSTLELQALEKENLYNPDGSMNSKMQACRLFLVAVSVLLLIACINYVNLITARASRRIKELYVRKVLGARKTNLYPQFFNEFFILFFFSLVAATIVIYLIFPAYNQLTGKQMEFHLFSVGTGLVYGITFLFTTLFAGIYPVIYLTGKRNIQGVSPEKSGVNVFIRKTLVVLQFAAAVVLILGAITINRQMNYIKMKNPGYDKENLICVRFSRNMMNEQTAIGVKSKLASVKSIKGVSVTSGPIHNIQSQNGSIECEGIGEVKTWIRTLAADEDFIPVSGVKLLEGSNFTGSTADSSHFILNQTAIEKIGIKDPIGKEITYFGIKGPIIGVVEDFHFESMHNPIMPLVIMMFKGSYCMHVRTYPQGTQETLDALEKVWKEYNNSDNPFSYSFMDEEFEKTYKSDLRIQTMINWFSIVAIFISCLGLFGLVTYTAETKTKEIGIRKVLGASVKDIVNMLSKEFLILVGIAMLIAFPLAYYWLDKMLQDYAYRISLSWWIFILTGMITIALTLLTVGWQAIKAATANPVKSIKTE